MRATLAILILAFGPTVQDPPKTVLIKAVWADTSLDLWEELRQVDPKFKALGDDVARIAKGLEAEEIEAREKAATQLKSLGLTAYGHLKALRDKTGSDAVRAQLDGVLKSLADDTEKSLPVVPGARRIGGKETEALKTRLKEKDGLRHQMPFMSLRDGQRGIVSVGDARPVGHKVRSITIEGDGKAARIESQGPLIKAGIMIEILPKIDAARGTTTLNITATARGTVGADPTEVTVRLAPDLGTKEGFLAGPFPSPEEKGEPWWIFVVECQVIP